MSRVRFQMFLNENQKVMLERLHQESKIPIAEIIRRAIDRFITEWKEKDKIPREDHMTENMLSIAGVCKGGPKDLADGHDRYLYGISRK